MYTYGTIAARYLKGWFPIDLVSCIPIDLISVVSGSSSFSKIRAIRFVRLLRLMKLVRILKASRILQRWEHKIGISYSERALLKFMIMVIVSAHWVRRVGGCV